MKYEICKAGLALFLVVLSILSCSHVNAQAEAVFRRHAPAAPPAYATKAAPSKYDDHPKKDTTCTHKPHSTRIERPTPDSYSTPKPPKPYPEPHPQQCKDVTHTVFRTVHGDVQTVTKTVNDCNNHGPKPHEYPTMPPTYGGPPVIPEKGGHKHEKPPKDHSPKHEKPHRPKHHKPAPPSYQPDKPPHAPHGKDTPKMYPRAGRRLLTYPLGKHHHQHRPRPKPPTYGPKSPKPKSPKGPSYPDSPSSPTYPDSPSYPEYPDTYRGPEMPNVRRFAAPAPKKQPPKKKPKHQKIYDPYHYGVGFWRRDLGADTDVDGGFEDGYYFEGPDEDLMSYDPTEGATPEEMHRLMIALEGDHANDDDMEGGLAARDWEDEDDEDDEDESDDLVRRANEDGDDDESDEMEEDEDEEEVGEGSNAVGGGIFGRLLGKFS